MSFLFGKKKAAQNAPVPPASRDGHTSGGSNSSIPTVNGLKSNKGPATTQSPTPGSSVNNSIDSAGGAATPSPEHGPEQRGGPEPEVQVCCLEGFVSGECLHDTWLTEISLRSTVLDLESMALLRLTPTRLLCIHGLNDD